MTRSLLATPLLLLILTTSWAETRTWKDQTGRFEIEAELVRVDRDQVVLKKADGKIVQVPLNRLSQEDRLFLRAREEQAAGGKSEFTGEDISEWLTSFLTENGDKTPSLAAAVVLNGKLKARGATGLRKLGDSTPVTGEDLYHLGSCTKSMTATLAAALVEDGVLAWDATVGTVLRDLKMRDEYEGVTLEMLLSNTGGFPKDVPAAIWSEAWGAKGKPTKQREMFAEAMLQEPARYPPGTGYEYSNSGFAIAGLMLERAAKESWEDLLRERLFQPLQMTSAGFGAPGTSGKLDQPWGHRASGEPVEPGPGADNPAAIGPAGIVHCSILDFARYVRMHTLKETGPVLKEAASFEKLHTVVSEQDRYALGWLVLDRPWAEGVALHHSGSNTWFTAVMWLAPERDFAVVVATNRGSEIASQPLDQLVGALIQKYL